MLDPVRETCELVATLRRARFIAALRPDKYGGENVYPVEVEKTLAAHSKVAEASVIGMDDEQYGQRLVAFVVLEPGASVTLDTLKQHVRDNLANYPRRRRHLARPPHRSTHPTQVSQLEAMEQSDPGLARRRTRHCSANRRPRLSASQPRADTAGLTDRQAMHAILADPANRYLSPRSAGRTGPSSTSHRSACPGTQSTGCANPAGTLLAQWGFIRQARLDRSMTLNCENSGGRGRYRTADRWCVKPELYH